MIFQFRSVFFVVFVSFMYLSGYFLTFLVEMRNMMRQKKFFLFHWLPQIGAEMAFKFHVYCTVTSVGYNWTRINLSQKVYLKDPLKSVPSWTKVLKFKTTWTCTVIKPYIYIYTWPIDFK